MSNQQDVGTRFIASTNHKLIEIFPAIHEPDAPTCELDAEGVKGHCITCSDEAVTV